MAVDNPFGLIPIRYVDGRPYNGARVKVQAASATGNIFIGEPVRPSGTGSADGYLMQVEGCPGTEGTPDSVLGVCVGIDPDPAAPNVAYSKTGAIRNLYIVPAKGMVFKVQEDGDTTPLAVTAIGTNCDHILTVVGDTSTGVSGIELDSSSTSATNGQWRVLRRLDNLDDGDHALAARAVWEVMMNESELYTGAAGT